jgi:hypothetical protein
MRKPKRHPQTALTGRLGVNLIERIVTRMGHAWNESTVDVGIDGTIELCRPDTREALNRVVLVQSKATQARFPKESDEEFEWPCDARDIDHWMGGNTPVVLIVSRSLDGTEEAYWVDVKEHFADPRARKSGKVHFHKVRDRFDEGCAARLMALGAPRSDGLYMAPSPRHETLLSNLLRVSSFAPKLYTADADFHDEQALWGQFRGRGQEPGSEWALWNKRIYGFLDLEREPFRSVCDLGTLDVLDTDYLALSEDQDMTNLFIRLLRKALRQKLWRMGVRYDGREKHYHFTAGKDKEPRAVSYRGREKHTSRAVFERYPDKRDPKKTAYYRHSAFQGRFHRFDGAWYLEITPTYRFTSDGYAVHRFAADYLKKIKEMELNDAVAGQVIMWAEVLRDPPDLVRPDYLFLSFGGLETFDISVGIDDASWHPRDDALVGVDPGGIDTLDMFAQEEHAG